MATNPFRQLHPESAAATAIERSRPAWKTPAMAVAATGLVALCAHIAVPLGFTPVPFTMQTFAVLLVGLLLTPRVAFAAMALYLAEGAVGLPVFQPQGLGGLAQLLGPTGGYLLAFPLAAAAASFLFERSRRGFPGALAAAAAGSALFLAFGAAWLGFLTHAGFSALLAESVLPFLPGDLFKLLAAAGCVSLLRSFRGPRNQEAGQ